MNIMMFHDTIRLGEIVGEFHLLTSGPIDDLFFSIYPSVAGTDLRLGFEANPALYTARDLDLHSRQFERTLDQFVTVPPETTVGQIEVLTTDERWQLVPSAGLPAGEPATLPTDSGLGDTRRREQESGSPSQRPRTDVRRAQEPCERPVHQVGGPRYRSRRRGRDPRPTFGAIGDRISCRSPLRRRAVVRGSRVPGRAHRIHADRCPSEGCPHITSNPTDGMCRAGRVLPTATSLRRGSGATRTASSFARRRGLCGLYTSGSTGQPKGVAVTHRGATSLLNAHVRTWRSDASARIAHMAATSFDVAMMELLLAHGSGATAVVVPPDWSAG